MKINYFALFIKKFLRFLLKPLSFVPALLVMAMIFSFSAQDADESGSLSTVVTEKIVHSINYRTHRNWTPAQQQQKVDLLEHYVRKLAHFSEYALLAVTLALPLYVYGARGIFLFLLTLIIAYAYACADEYHQTFVAGRSGQFSDTLIDLSGAFLGTLLFHPILHFFRVTLFRPLSLEKEREARREWEEAQRERRRREKRMNRHRGPRW